MVLNRHVARNVIFLPGSGAYPPSPPEPGSSVEMFRMACAVSEGAFSALDAGDGALNAPLSLIETLRREGWPIGYFYTGRDPFHVEDSFGRQFEAVVGRETTTEETTGEILNEAVEWIKRLENRNFVLIFDPVGASSESGLQEQLFESVAQFLLGHLFEKDSLVIVYNTGGNAPLWTLSPDSVTLDIANQSTWAELLPAIRTEFLELPE